MEKSSRKRSREPSSSSDADLSAPLTKRIKLNDDVVLEEIDLPDELLLLGILDDVDETEAVEDLDSVIKSFEEEIKHPEEPSPPQTAEEAVGVELGFLLGASDDELGLPPKEDGSEVLVDVDFGELGLYDLGELGLGEEMGVIGYVDTEEGEGVFGNGFEDRTEFIYRPEVLPAL